MVFLVATTTVCDRCDGCVTTEIGNVNHTPQIGHESDRELRSAGACNMNQIFEQFVQNLSMSDNTPEIERLLRRTLDQYGFPCFAYLSFAPRGDDDDTLAMTTYPSSWVEQYCANRYDRIDPVIARSITTTLPFAWSADKVDTKLTNKQKLLLEEASAFGIRHGVTIPIHDRQGKVATLTLAACDSRSAFDARVEQYRHQLHLIAIYLHAQLRKVTPAAISPPRPCLTQRERSCLQWAARGKSALDTAEIISVSRRTVVFHTENAKRKLGVATVQQAVAKGLMYDIISM
jgi:LuxR family transcriptional activator of conjugal transfer of Ti plasmids